MAEVKRPLCTGVVTTNPSRMKTATRTTYSSPSHIGFRLTVLPLRSGGEALKASVTAVDPQNSFGLKGGV